MPLLLAVNDFSPATLQTGGTTSVLGSSLTNDEGSGLRITGARPGTEGIGGVLAVLPPLSPVGPDPVLTLTGTYGILVIDRFGQWHYQLRADFPATAGLDANTHYENFTYEVTDASGARDLAEISVSVVGSNHAPIIVSNDGQSLAKVKLTRVEGHKAITNIEARDDGNAPLKFSIIGGADAKLFEINASSGALSFKVAPHYETPRDHGKDNVYDVSVSVSDGALSDRQDIAIRIQAVGATIVGAAGSDCIGPNSNARHSTPFTDLIDGRDGCDWLDGGGGQDTILGGRGSDILIGGPNHDYLSGGQGADFFVFNTPFKASSTDVVTDFDVRSDMVVVTQSATAGLGFGFLENSRFFAAAGANAGHDADDRIIYDTNSGALFYDKDGDGPSSSVKIAVLDHHPALHASNLFVVWNSI